MPYKSFYSFLFIAVLLFGCKRIDNEQFEEISEDLYFKRISIGEDRKAEENDIVVYSFNIKNKFDIPIPLLAYNNSYSYFDTVNLKNLKKGSPLSTIIKLMNVGDSNIYKMPYKIICKEKKWQPAIRLSPVEQMYLYIKVISSENQLKFKSEITSDSSYKRYLKNRELSDLNHYISSNKNISFKSLDNYFYKSILKKGNGKKCAAGNQLDIEFEGKFLNGEKFDDSKAYDKSFNYIAGTPDQLIKGLEKAIMTMEEGEKAIFVFSSDWGYGEKGNSNGIVEPYKSLIFEVFLKNIN